MKLYPNQKRFKGKRELGQGIIEFALVLPALLLTLMGIADFGRLFAAYSNLFNAAREGARYGIVNPTDVSGIELTSRDTIKFVSADDVDIFVHFDSGPNTPMKDFTAVNIGDRVIVTVDADVEMMTPFIRAIVSQLHVETVAARTISTLGGVGSGADPPPPPTATPDPNNPTATPVPPSTDTPMPSETPDPAFTPEPTPDLAPIHIDIPLWDGDMIVTGQAEPGETVFLRDIQDAELDLSTTVAGDGTFQFNLPKALVAGHVISVQGYGYIDYAVVQGTIIPTATPTPTSTPTPTPTPSAQYIDVTPTCGPAGDITITVTGHQWPVNKGDLLFFWDGVQVHSISARSDFNTDITVNGDSGYHTVRVQTANQGNVYYATKPFDVPCPITPTPTPSQPNLIVESIALENGGTLSTFDPLTFTVGVRNIGAAAANSLFWVDLFTDPAVALPSPADLAGEVSVAWAAVGSLAESESISVSLKYEEGFATTGQHNAVALADTWDQVLESDEEDNVSGVLTVDVPLAGTPPTPTPTPTPGGVQTGAISGSTWLYINGDVVPQGRVTVSCYDGDQLVAETLSDQDGNYLLDGLPPGNYSVIGQTFISGVLYSDIVLNVVVQSGQTTDYVTLVLH
jgi:Flp pilus assembly protein TadG